MTQNIYKITKKDLYDLFGRLAESYRVLVPYVGGERFHFGDFDPKKEDIIELGGIRQSQPLKSFINPARESIIDHSKSGEPSKPVIIAGVKGCDLSSLALQDFVFMKGDVEDPFYAEGRNKALLIGCDCTYAKETCFCTAMEGAPYPKNNFDINLSAITDYFLVEVRTDKGAVLVKKFKTFFKEPDDNDIEIRDKNRQRVSSQIEDFIKARGTKRAKDLKGAVKKSYNLIDLWKDFSSTCVECGACNLVCPTCHCFLLFDERSKEFAKRYRVWDACLYKSFARVAGGANPRKHLYERLRNRFDKKFDFFPQVMDYYACTGCGRCIEACPGNIDLREVLKGTVDGKWNKPPND